jgi:hypothetical protein
MRAHCRQLEVRGLNKFSQTTISGARSCKLCQGNAPRSFPVDRGPCLRSRNAGALWSIAVDLKGTPNTSVLQRHLAWAASAGRRTAESRRYHGFALAKSSASGASYDEALKTCAEDIMQQLEAKGGTDSSKVVSVLWVNANQLAPVQSEGRQDEVDNEHGTPTFLESMHLTLPQLLSQNLIAAIASPFLAPETRSSPSSGVASEDALRPSAEQGEAPPVLSPPSTPAAAVGWKLAPPRPQVPLRATGKNPPWVAMHTLMVPSHYKIEVFHAPNDSLPDLGGETWKHLMKADAAASSAGVTVILADRLRGISLSLDSSPCHLGFGLALARAILCAHACMLHCTCTLMHSLPPPEPAAL